MQPFFDFSSFAAGLNGSFFGMSTLTMSNEFLFSTQKKKRVPYFSSKESEKIQSSRLYCKSLQEVQALELIRKFCGCGLVSIAVNSTPELKELLKYIRDDLHGKNVRAGLDEMCRRSFGDKGKHKAKDFCTSFAEEVEPPRIIAVSGNTHLQPASMFKLQIGKVADCIERLDKKTVHILRTTAVKWISPCNYPEDDKNGIFAPVLMSSTRARMNRAAMSASHLSRDQQRVFGDAYIAMCEAMAFVSEEIIVSAPHIFMMDNHLYAHSVVGFPNCTALVQKVVFDLEQHPALYRVLEFAYHHPLYQSILTRFNSSLVEEDKDPEKFLQLSNWPMSKKNEYLLGVKSVFAETFFSNPDMYWSASSGTTGSSELPRIDSIFPTEISEMYLMRKRLREKYVEKGLITSKNVVANLLNWGNMATSMEVQCEIFQGSNIAHLPLGGKISIEQTCKYIEKYGATTVIGLGSRIMQIAIHCIRTGRRLSTVTRLVHGGENFSERALTSFSSIWNEHVKCYGIYGSSEAGIFGLKSPGEEYYELMDDSVYLEIVDECGEPTKSDAVGTLVVTNLIREVHPMIKYNTGDFGHFPSSDHTKFMLKGRNLNSIKRQFGSKTVTWKDIEEAVGELIEDVFEGLCIYQMWVINESEGIIQLAIYGRVLNEEKERKLCEETIEKLGEVFTDETNISQILVEFIEDVEDVLRKTLTTKLEFFVDVERKISKFDSVTCDKNGSYCLV